MPTLSTLQAKPLRPDTTRLGPEEARRRAALLARPAPHGSRLPGGGGSFLAQGGGPVLRGVERPHDPVWGCGGL